MEKACDRCHRQKLRCIRDSDYSGGACIRCFKAQVRCVSSPSLRLRRGEARNSQSGSRKETVRKGTSAIPSPHPIFIFVHQILTSSKQPLPSLILKSVCRTPSYSMTVQFRISTTTYLIKTLQHNLFLI